MSVFMPPRSLVPAVLGVWLCAVLPAGAIDPPAEKREVVTILESTSVGGQVVQQVLKEILQTRLGVEARILTANETSQASPLDERGDIIPEIWLPAMIETWRSYIAPGSKESIRVNAAPYFGREGLYIPGYVQDLYGIRRVEDLADPQVAELFDLDGDGLGELWPGDPAWSSSVTIEELKAGSYGYEPYFEMLHLEVGAFVEHFRESYKARRPVLFYGWEPSELEISFDLRQLEEPPFDGYAEPRWPADSNYVPGGCWNFVDPEEDPEWRAKSSVRCGYPESEIWIGFRADLARRLPEVGRFLDRLEVSDLLVRTWIRLVDDFGLEPAEMAKIWVEENSQIVDDWLEGRPVLRLARLDWDTGRAVGAVLRVLLEGAGFQVREIDDERSYFDRVGRGGYLDIYPDFWLPEQLASWRRLVVPGSLETARVNEEPYLVHEGFFVPAEIEGVRHVEDLKKEEVVRQFDLDGDGRGEVWYGESGWPVTWIFEVKARSYGFAAGYEPLDLTFDELEDRLRAAKAEGKGLLFYGWDPSILSSRHALRRLEEPPFDGYARPRWEGDPLYKEDGCWSYVHPSEDPAWREISEIRCAAPASEVHIAFSAELERVAPEAARILRRMVLHQDMIASWMSRMANGEPPMEMARSWIAENPEIVRRWTAADE